MTNLSPNFTLQELIISETAARHGISNHPSESVLANLKRLALLLEEVRLLLGGNPLIITSGYRSREVNTRIGGSPTSAHCHGLAADFIAPPLSPLQACRKIADSAITFDQLIYEYDWVHLGLGMDRQRREILTKTGSRYVTGIVEK